MYFFSPAVVYVNKKIDKKKKKTLVLLFGAIPEFCKIFSFITSFSYITNTYKSTLPHTLPHTLPCSLCSPRMHRWSALHLIRSSPGPAASAISHESLCYNFQQDRKRKHTLKPKSPSSNSCSLPSGCAAMHDMTMMRADVRKSVCSTAGCLSLEEGRLADVYGIRAGICRVAKLTVSHLHRWMFFFLLLLSLFWATADR